MKYALLYLAGDERELWSRGRFAPFEDLTPMFICIAISAEHYTTFYITTHTQTGAHVVHPLFPSWLFV